MPVTRYYPTATTTTTPSHGPSGSQSSALPNGTLNTNTVTREYATLATAKASTLQEFGLAATVNSLAQTGRQSTFAGYASFRLGPQTIPAGTWTIAYAASENNTAANSFVALSIYVWRPSTSTVVGYVYDSNAELGAEWATSAASRVASVSGQAVTAQWGDTLVVELWHTAAQGMSTAYPQQVWVGAVSSSSDITTDGGATASGWIDAPDALVAYNPLGSFSRTPNVVAEPVVANNATRLNLGRTLGLSARSVAATANTPTRLIGARTYALPAAQVGATAKDAYGSPTVAANTLLLQLWQGNTLIAARTESSGLTSSWQDYEWVLTAGEFNAITDYDALTVRMYWGGGGTVSVSRVAVKVEGELSKDQFATTQVKSLAATALQPRLVVVRPLAATVVTALATTPGTVRGLVGRTTQVGTVQATAVNARINVARKTQVAAVVAAAQTPALYRGPSTRALVSALASVTAFNPARSVGLVSRSFGVVTIPTTALQAARVIGSLTANPTNALVAATGVATALIRGTVGRTTVAGAVSAVAGLPTVLLGGRTANAQVRSVTVVTSLADGLGGSGVRVGRTARIDAAAAPAGVSPGPVSRSILEGVVSAFGPTPIVVRPPVSRTLAGMVLPVTATGVDLFRGDVLRQLVAASPAALAQSPALVRGSGSRSAEVVALQTAAAAPQVALGGINRLLPTLALATAVLPVSVAAGPVSRALPAGTASVVAGQSTLVRGGQTRTSAAAALGVTAGAVNVVLGVVSRTALPGLLATLAVTPGVTNVRTLALSPKSLGVGTYEITIGFAVRPAWIFADLTWIARLTSDLVHQLTLQADGTWAVRHQGELEQQLANQADQTWTATQTADVVHQPTHDADLSAVAVLSA